MKLRQFVISRFTVFRWTDRQTVTWTDLVNSSWFAGNKWYVCRTRMAAVTKVCYNTTRTAAIWPPSSELFWYLCTFVMCWLDFSFNTQVSTLFANIIWISMKVDHQWPAVNHQHYLSAIGDRASLYATACILNDLSCWHDPSAASLPVPVFTSRCTSIASIGAAIFACIPQLLWLRSGTVMSVC